jgi:hypothetical protein
MTIKIFHKFKKIEYKKEKKGSRSSTWGTPAFKDMNRNRKGD